FDPLDIEIQEAAFGIIVIGGCLAAIVSPKPLVAVLSLGIVGFGLTLLYFNFAAPDLAVTQFLVETLTAFVVAFIFVRLPATQGRIRLKAVTLWDAGISVILGVLVMFMSGLILRHELPLF